MVTGHAAAPSVCSQVCCSTTRRHQSSLTSNAGPTYNKVLRCSRTTRGQHPASQFASRHIRCWSHVAPENCRKADLVMISGQHDHRAGPLVSAESLQGSVERLHGQRGPDMPEVTQEDDASTPESEGVSGSKEGRQELAHNLRREIFASDHLRDASGIMPPRNIKAV